MTTAPVKARTLPAAGTAPAPDWGQAASDTARVRLVLAVASLVYLAAGLAAMALGAHTIRWFALLVFCAVGIGSAPWQLNAGMGLTTRLLASGVTALTAWTVVPTAMELTGWWSPYALFTALACAAAVLHLLALVRVARDMRRSRGKFLQPGHFRRKATASRWPIVIATVGGLVCLGAVLLEGPVQPGFWGFLTQVGPVWYVGLALVLGAFVLSLGDDERSMAIVVIVLAAVLTLTPSLIYESVRSQSAFKHVDMIEQIRQTGVLRTPNAAYNAWPGFFAAMAWLCDVTGIHDPLNLATYWPPLLATFRITALRALAGRVLATPAQRWIAVVLALLADSLGADYFSPQSVGFVLGLAAFALALSPGLGRARPVLLLAAGCTLAVSHQLSPFIASGVVILLALFRQVRPWWLTVLVAGPAVGWALLHIDSVLAFVSLDSLGSLSNFRPPPVSTSPGLSRLPAVTATIWALVIGVLIIGLMALRSLLRSRGERRTWALACAPAAGFSLIAVNPYGQEGIFRAVLFAIPWLAVLAARFFAVRRGHRSRGPLLLVTAALTGCFLVSSFGLDGIYVIRPADVAAVRYAQQQGGSNYQLLYLGPGDLPDTLRRGPVLLTLDALHVPTTSSSDPALEARRVTKAYADYDKPADGGPSTMYALWSPISGMYAQAYGLEEPAQFAAFRNALLATPYWKVLFERNGTFLLQFDWGRYAVDQAAGKA